MRLKRRGSGVGVGAGAGDGGSEAVVGAEDTGSETGVEDISSEPEGEALGGRWGPKVTR